MQALENEYGIRRFFFFDDHFLGPHDTAATRIVELADKCTMLQRRYRLRIALSADTVVSLGQDGLSALRRAGVERVFIGIESFNGEQLQELGKTTLADVNTNVDAIARLDANGIAVHCGFINFTPSVTKEQLLANGAGLCQTRLGACFRYFRSVLYYGPGSALLRPVGDSSLTEGPSSCVAHLPDEWQMALSQLNEAYDVLRDADYRSERLDYAVVRALDHTYPASATSLALYHHWQRIRSAMAKRNFAFYRGIICHTPVVGVSELLRQHMADLDELAECIAGAGNT